MTGKPLTIFSLLLSVSVCVQSNVSSYMIVDDHQSLSFISSHSSDVIAIPDNNPWYGLLGSSAACFYTTNESILKPLLIFQNGMFSVQQQRFLEQYGSDGTVLLTLGDTVDSPVPTIPLLGSPTDVSLQLSTYLFSKVSSALILACSGNTSYALGVQACPLASYLHIPILLCDHNYDALQETLATLQVSTLLLVGNITSSYFASYDVVTLSTSEEIQQQVLAVIKERFGTLRYLTLTNPSDTTCPSVDSIENETYFYKITSTQLVLLTNRFQLQGTDTIQQNFIVPSGIVHLTCQASISTLEGPMTHIPDCVPIIFMTIKDADGNIISYSQSSGFELKQTIGFSLIVDTPGTYTVNCTIYHGFLGGFFSQRGLSIVDAGMNLTITQEMLHTAHFPLVPSLSMMAPYLTSAHGGMLLASDSWQLTTEEYRAHAHGIATGPWYNELLQGYNNEQVNKTITCLLQNMSLIEKHDLLDAYLSGPAWLAILADTNMIPMYYYQPSQPGLIDKGLPSDNPYSLNQSLSVGRVLGHDVSDVSVLLCRTFFYNQLCGNVSENIDWHNSFHFIFGEGYGETGGIFHQIPYSREITEYGFNSTVYGDFRNSRQAGERLGSYTEANYIEYLGHGDWFWFTPSIYGIDLYGQAIDVAHAKEWVYDYPSVFLTSACLMGRVDGLYPNTNIGLTMLHAGCNAFVGSTRETGQESGLTLLENHLIVDNFSLGEAVRGEKQRDREPPTYYVRTLYGDPAFNPYEPNNGFSNQGRPTLL